MIYKGINYLLVISFLLCYMEWGVDQSAFVFQIHYEVFASGRNFADSILHPVILFGLSGEVCVLYAALAKRSFGRWNSLGVVLMGLVVMVLLTAGIASQNFRMIGSNVPFLVFAVMYYLHVLRLRKEAKAREQKEYGARN